jgi:hypothetical protein
VARPEGKRFFAAIFRHALFHRAATIRISVVLVGKYAEYSEMNRRSPS